MASRSKHADRRLLARTILNFSATSRPWDCPQSADLGDPAQHGFRGRLDKSRHELLSGQLSPRDGRPRLARVKHENRNPQKLIESIFRGELTDRDVEQPHLREICHAVAPSLQNRPAPGPLLRLLTHVTQLTDLVSSQPVRSDLGRCEGNTSVSGLSSLGRHSGGWIRPVRFVRPERTIRIASFRNWWCHLFARWPVPAFMDSAWFAANSKVARRHQRWFLHLGRGENIRTASLPILYTKQRRITSCRRRPIWTSWRPCDGDRFSGWGAATGCAGDCADAPPVRFRSRRFPGRRCCDSSSANPMLDPAQLGSIIELIAIISGSNALTGLRRAGEDRTDRTAATESVDEGARRPNPSCGRSQPGTVNWAPRPPVDSDLGSIAYSRLLNSSKGRNRARAATSGRIREPLSSEGARCRRT